MHISPNEIAHVEEAGMLDANPVKMIRTRGGYWIAVGRKKGSAREEALAAGSHPAIVKYNLEKQNPGFQAMMMKSEDGLHDVVDQHSHFLSEDLRKSGHDIYSVTRGTKVAFKITHHNVEKHEISGYLSGGEFIVNNLAKMEKSFARSMAGAVTEVALSLKASKIKIGE